MQRTEILDSKQGKMLNDYRRKIVPLKDGLNLNTDRRGALSQMELEKRLVEKTPRPEPNPKMNQSGLFQSQYAQSAMASQIQADIRNKKKKLKQQFNNATYGNRQFDKLINNLNDAITDYYSVSAFYFLRGKVWLERLSNYLK
jgi:hypothetical protein